MFIFSKQIFCNNKTAYSLIKLKVKCYFKYLDAIYLREFKYPAQFLEHLSLNRFVVFKYS
jgi:hypothetical protein